MAGRLWHIALTMSGAEAQAETWLKAEADAADTFFPSEVYWKRLPNAGRNKPRKIPIFKAIVPGYLFVRFNRHPQTTRIKDDCKHIYGWLKVGERPVVVTEGVLMHMAQMPAHLADMVAERRRLIEEARTFHPGDTARVTSGTFEGWEVTISDTCGEMVIFDTPLGEATVSRDLLEKRRA